MASAHSFTRLEILAHALVERGMPEDRAAALSNELLAQHPYVGRHGVAALKGAIRDGGLTEPTAAEETALMLLGVELLGRGATYGHLLRALQHYGVPADEARGVGLESARLQRAIAAGRPTAPAGPHAELLGWAVFVIVLGTALAAILHQTY